MRCGLYGKLPSKRDFVSIETPRNFLGLWEPWLAECLTQSRESLGEADWREAFGEAPVWRFSLPSLPGVTGLFGAVTPSMDAVGRYFPLTLVAQEAASAAADAFAKPETDSCQIWFDAAEEFLLSILDGDCSRDAIDAGLKDLGALDREGPDKHPEAKSIAFCRLDDDDEADARPLDEIFAEGRSRQGATAAGVNYWWTLGCESYRPRAFVQKLLPDPVHFAAMLTERRAGPAREASW
jgi:type VI secretion system protein ImpM